MNLALIIICRQRTQIYIYKHIPTYPLAGQGLPYGPTLGTNRHWLPEPYCWFPGFWGNFLQKCGLLGLFLAHHAEEDRPNYAMESRCFSGNLVLLEVFSFFFVLLSHYFFSFFLSSLHFLAICCKSSRVASAQLNLIISLLFEKSRFLFFLGLSHPSFPLFFLVAFGTISLIFFRILAEFPSKL